MFYRTTCASEARRLGVTGWVRNRPDGSVEAVFEGADRDVDSMVEWCRRGPEPAAVEAVETTAESPSGEAGFRIEG